jgi:hypothetical protein
VWAEAQPVGREFGAPLMTVSDLIAILHTLSPDARVIVQGYESGFNDATGAVIQPIVVNGNHQPRPGLGGGVDIPADYGGGDHEAPDDMSRVDLATLKSEQAVYITSTRKR